MHRTSRHVRFCCAQLLLIEKIDENFVNKKMNLTLLNEKKSESLFCSMRECVNTKESRCDLAGFL